MKKTRTKTKTFFDYRSTNTQYQLFLRAEQCTRCGRKSEEDEEKERNKN